MFKSRRVACLAGLAAVSMAWITVAAPAVVPASTQTPVERARLALLNPLDPTVLVVSHRGNTRDHAENSLSAIRAAADAGAAVAEIDIAKTSDGAYVLMHDATVNRTTTGKGKVIELTLEQIRALCLVDGLRPTSERVPTLAEAFDAARGRILLNLDPKDLSLPDAAALARDAKMLDHCVFKLNWTKMDEPMKRWLNENPDVFFMPICDGLAEVELALAERPWKAIEVIFKSAEDPINNKATIARIVQGGTRLWINSLLDGRWSGGLSDREGVLDPDKVYGSFIDLGFGIIQTDLTEQVVDVARRRSMPTTSPAGE